MIPYGRQTIEEDDIQAVVDVLRSPWLTQGPKVAEFERALAAYCGAKRAVVFSNGTVALQAAYFAAGLKSGDEFITSPLTFAATANAGLWLGARPVFADIDPATGNLDPEKAERAITAKTRAIMPVDYAGRPADLDAFRDIAKRKGLLIVEDACHALGASYRGRKIGSLSDMTIFSFHPVKSITTGEGGAVLTDDDRRAEELASFRVHGITRRHEDWRYEIGELGQNGRLTDLQCALGLSQLKKLDGFIARRAEIAARYLQDMKGMAELTLPPAAAAPDCAWHLFPVRLRLERLSASRGKIFQELRAAGIGLQVHYVPVYLHPLYQGLGYPAGSCPEAERFYEEELSLPLFPQLTEEERGRVLRALGEILSKYRRPLARTP